MRVRGGEEGRDGTGLWAAGPTPQAIASKVEGVLIGLFASCIYFTQAQCICIHRIPTFEIHRLQKICIYVPHEVSYYVYVPVCLVFTLQHCTHMEIYNTFISIRN